MMLDLLRKASKVLSYLFRPFIIGWNSISFFVRYLLAGRSNAFSYLSRVGKESIIPIMRLMGAQIGSNCDIETGIVFHNCHDLRKLRIGNDVHIGKQCFFDLREEIHISSNVVVSMNCTFITHMELNQSNLSAKYPGTSGRIEIGDHTYIGANSIVLMGVTIGKQSFVGAKSMVNRNVASSWVVYGTPAKRIKVG